MLSPIITMFKHFPLRAYSTVLILLLLSLYAFRSFRKQCRSGSLTRQQGILSWTLVNYLLILIFFTVLGRRSLDYDRIRLDFGYSYRAIGQGDLTLAPQVAANIGAFVPVGFLVCLLTKRFPFLKGLISGLLLSSFIESMQYSLRCGTVEIDDLLSNLLGTTIGCLFAGIYWFVKKGRLR